MRKRPAFFVFDGADSERISKSWNGNTTHFLGNDTELLVNAASPAGLLTSHLHADVKREGALTSYQVKDQLSSNRLTLMHNTGVTTPLLTTHSYGPYGQPLTSDGSAVAGGVSGGKGYINERVACPRA